MPYLLSIEVSPLVESSTSRKVGAQFVDAYKRTHPSHTVVHRDLAAKPLPHLDAEALSAAYVPEGERSESMAAKHKLRLDLIKEIQDADAVVIATPMYNWNVPSALKAYIDQIIMPGVFDPYGNGGLKGKPITIIYATGSAYGEESGKADIDFVGSYLKQLVKLLGATDVSSIRSELTLAGVVPGMESLVDAKAASFAKAVEDAKTRAAAI